MSYSLRDRGNATPRKKAFLLSRSMCRSPSVSCSTAALSPDERFSTAFTRARTSFTEKGLLMKSSPPAEKPVSRSFSLERAVRNMTGTSQPSF